MQISDPVYLLEYLFAAGDPLLCEDAGDANDDEEVDVSDPVYILLWMFGKGDPPPFPGTGACGPDLATHPGCGPNKTNCEYPVEKCPPETPAERLP